MAEQVIDTTPNAFFERQAMVLARDLTVVYRQLFKEIFQIIEDSEENELTPAQVKEKILALIEGEREPEPIPDQEI